MQRYLAYFYPIILNFFAKGWSDDLEISFKKAVINDVKNFQLRLILIPACFALAMVTTVASLVFLLYGGAQWMAALPNDALVSSLTGALLALVAFIAGSIFYINLRFLLRRVESVQTARLRAREMRPLHQLYQQVKEEQNMLLDALLKNNNKRSIYESDNIGTV